MKKKKGAAIVIIILLLLIAGAAAVGYFVPSVRSEIEHQIARHEVGPFRLLMSRRATVMNAVPDVDEGRIFVIAEGPDLKEMSVTVSLQDETRTYSANIGRPLSLMVPLEDFEYKAGTYEVNVEGIGKKSIEISPIRGTLQADTPGAAVYVSDLVAPEELWRMEYEVWYQEDASDLELIASENKDDGFYAVADVEAHDYHLGDYQVHAYAMIGEERYSVAETTLRLAPENIVLSWPGNDSGTQEVIRILNACVDGVPAETVDFATWSDANGQDDIRYYQGTDIGDNSYEVRIGSGAHSGAGSYTTHIIANGEILIGDTYYELTKAKQIALTFDDGPSGYTNTLLDQLEAYNARATFFVVGSCASNYPSVIQREIALGCEVGSHTVDHTVLTKVDGPTIQNKVQAANQIIYDITGYWPTIMRPPGGGVNDTVRANVNMPMILWDIDTRDWETKDTQSTIDAVLGSVSDGDIILMHDLYQPTINAALYLIPELQNMGYELVTVPELAASHGYGLYAGSTYRSFK